MHSKSSTGPARRLGPIKARSASIAAIAVLLVGCGSGSEHGLSSGQRAGLTAQLEAARVQAAAKNVSGTEAALRSFRASVVRLQRSGALSGPDARALRLGAQRVLARVKGDAAPPPAPTPTVTQATPAPAPAPAPKHPPKPKDLKKLLGKPGHGHGKGKGHGGGEGGD